MIGGVSNYQRGTVVALWYPYQHNGHQMWAPYQARGVRSIGSGADKIGVRCQKSDPFCPYAHTNPAEHLVRHCAQL
jgi:hypothetical protein